MSYEATGTVKVISDLQTFDSGFTKREFVITTQEQYPQDIKFELVKDRTSLVDSYKLGDKVKVSFNIRGNEFNGKYYVNLGAWKIENDAPVSMPPPMDPIPGMQAASSSTSTKNTPPPPLPEDDDLPF
jgi:single-strand DNA-binding protein